MKFEKLSDIFEDWRNLENSIKTRTSKNSNNYKKSSVSKSFDFIKLIQSWKDIVGEELAKESIPIKNKFKTLTILTSHVAYSNKLSFMETSIKEKIFTIFPKLKRDINRIQFTAKSSYFKDKLKSSRSFSKNINNKLHSQSPEYKKLKFLADKLLIDIRDEELRKTMTNIYIQQHSNNT